MGIVKIVYNGFGLEMEERKKSKNICVFIGRCLKENKELF